MSSHNKIFTNGETYVSKKQSPNMKDKSLEAVSCKPLQQKSQIIQSSGLL